MCNKTGTVILVSMQLINVCLLATVLESSSEIALYATCSLQSYLLSRALRWTFTSGDEDAHWKTNDY